jgi:phosphatidyl-myo-inositol alpha-mannosyltransferase
MPTKKTKTMDKYKIAFVLDDSLDKTDGVQQYVLTVGQWLAEQGHTVHYLVGETSRTDVPNIHSLGRNIKVRFNQNRMSIPLPVPMRRIRELLTREEYDIIHVQVPYSPWLGGRVVKAAGRLTGVVGTFHIAAHSRFVHAANVLLRLFVGGSLRRFDDFISVSSVAQQFAWETFRIESAVVPNTLRLEPFFDAKPRKDLATTTNIVFFGRLVERKGCQYFLRAVNKLRQIKALPKGCKVVVCGTGPLEKPLKEYVRQQGLDNIVEFTGFVQEKDKPAYLAAADIAVYPSTGGESFGIVLLEGMAASRGVVLAGDNPGYASVMGERPEVLFDPTNEDQFVSKLQRYLDSKDLRRQSREWQQQYVQQFDVPNVVDEILVVYNEALHKRRS